MKANFDFGYVKKEEREILRSFLNGLLSQDVNFLNKRVTFNQERERVVFKINDFYFSVGFNEKLRYQDEVKIFNALNAFHQNNVDIKRIPSYTNVFPIYEEELQSNGKYIYFSSLKDISSLKDELSDDTFFKVTEDVSIQNKTFIVTVNPFLLVKDYKKIDKDTYELTLAEKAILKANDSIGRDFLMDLSLGEDGKFNFEIANNKIDIQTKEHYMEYENLNKEENIEVKGEVYIGSLDIDIKQLLSLKEGDKIVLDRDKTIEGILKIGSKDVLVGALEFDEDSVKFVVKSTNF